MEASGHELVARAAPSGDVRHSVDGRAAAARRAARVRAACSRRRLAPDALDRARGRRRLPPRHAALAAICCAAACCAAALTALAGAFAGSASARAVAARTLSLHESGSLHMTNRRPPTLNEALNEQGSASGTIIGTIYIHLHIHERSVSAEVNIYPRGGSLSGTGSARYHVVGGQAQFTGTLVITRGTGSYAHARASSLAFTGTIQRRNDAVAVRLSGPLSL